MTDVLGYLQHKGLNPKRASANEVHLACFYCGEDDAKRGRLYVNVDDYADIPGLHTCFLCGARGSLVTIKKHFGDPIDEHEEQSQHQYEIFRVAAAYYHERLGEQPDAFQWLRGPGRNLTFETIVERQLGYASGGLYGHLRDLGYDFKDILATGLIYERGGKVADSLYDMVTIPYMVNGNCVSIRGRAFPYDKGDPRPKYKTCGGNSARLFNTDAMWRGEDEIVICEGEFDAMSVEQLGFSAVGVPGANTWQDAWDDYLTDVKRVWLVFDQDKAGDEGTKKLIERFGPKIKPIKLAHEAKPCDVSEWIGHGHTADELVRVMSEAGTVGLLVTVDQARNEHKELQGLDGIKFNNEELDHWIHPGLLPSQVMVTLAKSGTGKSHPVDSQVPTPRGFRRWGSLKPGDYVFGSDGKQTKVIAVHPQGVQPTYRVKFSDGTSSLASADHIWPVRYRYGRRREWHEKTMTTLEMLESGLRTGYNNGEYKYALPTCEPVQYQERRFRIDPYTLGAIISNGSCTGTSVVLTTPDDDVAQRVRCFHRAEKIHRLPGSCPAYVLTAMIGPVRDHGLAVRSADKFIPASYLLGSVEQRVALLHGLMDGDGTPVTQRKPNSSRYSTMSPRLADDMMTLVTSLGGTATRSRSKRDGEITLSIVLPYGIKPFSSARKSRVFEGSYMRRPHRAIVGIEQVESQNSMCITVDAPDSLYLVGRNHVVTHNTIWLLNTMQQMLMVPGQENLRFLFVSLEQTRGEWFERARRIHRFYNLAATDQDCLDFWRERLLIIDKNRLTEKELLASLDDYEYQMGAKPDVVFVDYLGYWARGFRGEAYQRTSDAIMTLKEIAKARMVPIITPHQVSRLAKYGEEPDADAARDAGVVEETADFLFLLWTPDAMTGSDVNDKQGLINLKIGKSRHGGRGIKIAYQFAPISLTLVPLHNTTEPKFLHQARNELVYERDYHDKWEQAVYRHRTGFEGHLEPNPAYQEGLPL